MARFALMLDREYRARRHMQPLAGDLDLERLLRFPGVSAWQQISTRIGLVDVPIGFHEHAPLEDGADDKGATMIDDKGATMTEVRRWKAPRTLTPSFR